MENEKRMLLDVDEFPKSKGQAFILALQHVLAMFVACITVPLIVFNGYVTSEGVALTQVLIAPTLVAAGVGTLFYLFMTKFKAPMFLASSFAYMAPMMSAIAIGRTVYGTAADGSTLYIGNLWILPVGLAMVGAV